jgi:hypothetical protein
VVAKRRSKKNEENAENKNVLYFRTAVKDGCIVRKVVEDPDGFHVESEHKVNQYGCDCEAFKFRKQCRHMNMFLLSHVEGKPVDLSSARESVRELISLFGNAFRRVSLPDEPYERGEDGSIVCATVLLSKPIKPSKILRSGVWEGQLKSNGLRVRLCISE